MQRSMRLALIGDPVEHSISPQIHRVFLNEAGLGGSYEAMRVPVGEVAKTLNDLRIRGYIGVNVTTPHKEEALAAATEADAATTAIGSTNTLTFLPKRGWVASNTDAVGARVAAARAAGREISGMRVLVLGTGPTGRATVYGLRAAGAEVFVWSRQPQKAETLCARLGGARYDGWAEIDLVFATLPPDPSLPAEIAAVLRDAPAVLDANYGTRSTLGALLDRPVVDGRTMLEAQARESFRTWLDAA